MNMTFLYRYSTSLERGAFAGRTGDYVWMLIVSGLILVLIGFWWPFPVMSSALLYVIIYYWSRMNAEAIASFYFGIQFPAIYLPWALIVFNLLLGKNPILLLVGIAVGHVYFFLEDVAPFAYGTRLINTPQFIYNMMDPALNVNTRHAPQRAAPRQAWGQGRRLNE